MIIDNEYIYKNKKSIFGVKVIHNKKYFYKKTENINKEVEGFNEVNGIYIIPKIAYCHNDEILYEYKKELENKTIHEYLYNKNILFVNYKRIFSQYKKSLKALVIKNECEYRNADFFLKRVNILDKYLKLDYVNKIYVIDNKEYSLYDIIVSIKDNLEESKKLKGILTLGDPTDTNISVSGLFTDFECAGYNSLVGEIAILFASFATHGCYFYPKYNGNAYILRTNLLFNYPKYKQDLVYFDDIDSKCILLPKFMILKKNKKVLLKFLIFYNKYFKDDMELFKYLKYYVCMRMLTPIDISQMDEYDRNLIISLVIYLYENVSDINSLIDIVRKMKVRNI